MAYILYLIGGGISLFFYFQAHADYVHARNEGCDHHAIQYLNSKLHFAICIIVFFIYMVRDEIKTT